MPWYAIVLLIMGLIFTGFTLVLYISALKLNKKEPPKKEDPAIIPKKEEG